MRLGCCILLTGLSLSGTTFTPRAYARAIVAGVIPNARACIIPSHETGQSTIRALQLVGPTPFAAQAIWGPGYPPTIIYSSVYFRLSSTLQLFLSLHECGHLVLRTTNEFEADCYAIAHADWTKADLDLIERSHVNLGTLPSRYGGNGHAFWAGTKNTCPQYFN